jgi:hypothetical protein
VDLDRIAENLTKRYRLEWPETLPPWPQNMSPLTRMVAPLAMNYASCYAQLASRYESEGKKAGATDAGSQAVAWMMRSGNADAARAFVDAWLARTPDDAKAKELKAGLERTGTQ